MRRACLLPGAAFSALACAYLPFALERPGCPLQPMSTDALPEEIDLHARMRFEVDDRDLGVEVISRRLSKDLLVVGLADHGSRIFTLRQRASEIQIETAASPRKELRHLALFVLDVLRRAYWLAPPSGAAPGTLRWEHAGERVVQRQVGDGVLRSFHRARGSDGARGGADDEPPVTIHYDEWLPDGFPTSPVRIESRWCGYRAVSVVLAASSAALDSGVEGPPPGGVDH